MVNANMDEREKYLTDCEAENKILCLSKQINQMSKLKNDLESELIIQNELMISSVQQGLSFNIPSSLYDDGEDDDYPHEYKMNHGQLVFYQTCLEKEISAIKDVLQTNISDMERLKDIKPVEKFTNKKASLDELKHLIIKDYSEDKDGENESSNFLKQKILFDKLSSKCFDHQNMANMFLTGKEDIRNIDVDSIINMSLKLHNKIDHSIRVFQDSRKELKLLKEEYSRKEDVVPVSMSHIISLLRRMDSVSFLQHDESLRKQIMMLILPQLVKLVDHKTQSLEYLRRQKISLASRILDLEKTASEIEGFPWEDQKQDNAISDYCRKLHHSNRAGMHGQTIEESGDHFVSLSHSTATNDEIC